MYQSSHRRWLSQWDISHIGLQFFLPSPIPRVRLEGGVYGNGAVLAQSNVTTISFGLGRGTEANDGRANGTARAFH